MTLTGNQNNSSDFLEKLLLIVKALSSERDRWVLYEKILSEAQKCCHADGGTLYITTEINGHPELKPVIFKNTSLALCTLNKGNPSSSSIDIPSFPFFHPKTLKPNTQHIATHCAISQKTINIKDTKLAEKYDISGIQVFDKNNNYHTKSILTVPLINHNDYTIGVIQLINAHHESKERPEFSKNDVEIIEALSSLVSVSIENNSMLDNQQNLLIRLASQKEKSKLFEVILDEAQHITHAEGGTLYLLKQADNGPTLEFTILKNKTLNLHYGGTSNTKVPFPALPLTLKNGKPNHKNIATFTALNKQLINIPDAYSNDKFDFSGTRDFDKRSKYRSQSFLSVPLVNHSNDVIGVIQLVNAMGVTPNTIEPFGKHIEPIIKALSTYAAISLENQILLEDHKNLLDAFIKCIAQAIDAKSPHTSAHCQRVPIITELLTEAVCNDNEIFSSFSLDTEGWYELKVASWLHDCGKLSTPDSILEKSTKLHSLRDGIDTINSRFDLIKSQKYNAYLENIIENGNSEKIKKQYHVEIEALEDDRNFINQTNKGSEFISQKDKDRITSIANHTWYDTKNIPHPLLTQEDINNLSISRGTLNTDERNKINDHMRVTIDMLNSLPFPKNLKKVPEYAGGHHEKMDGSGFPNQLTREQMSIPARIMGIADIFEALTSQDRPYKAPMKISQALSILKNMRDQKHIDHELYYIFVTKRVWELYSIEYLQKEQLDIEDPSPFL